MVLFCSLTICYITHVVISRFGFKDWIWVLIASVPSLYILLTFFFLDRFPLPLGAWDGLLYFIVALPGPSIYLSNIRGVICRIFYHPV